MSDLTVDDLGRHQTTPDHDSTLKHKVKPGSRVVYFVASDRRKEAQKSWRPSTSTSKAPLHHLKSYRQHPRGIIAYIASHQSPVTMIPPQKTAARPSKPPQKRPAHTSQDTSLHPPKKQRLEAAKGVAKVAGAGARARASGGKVKRKDGAEKTLAGQGTPGERLIPTAPAGGQTVESASVDARTESAEGARIVDAATVGKQAITKDVTEQSKAKPTKSDPKTTIAPSKPQAANNHTKITPKHSAGSTSANGKQLHTARRMQPTKPLTSDGQNALGRPKNASGSNPTRGIEGRDVVFVTRKTGLGSYMRRCKALLVEDGYVVSFPSSSSLADCS